MALPLQNQTAKSPNQVLEWTAGSWRWRYAAMSVAAATQLGC